ncbi:MAG: hypothetical protein M1816_004246, partial [Peltula sp. TS41687]
MPFDRLRTRICKCPRLTLKCAANAFQAAFARYRLSQGLPARAIALGMILEVGF